MKITEISVATIAVVLISMGLYIYSYLSGNVLDGGIIYTSIAAIAGLAGYDMGKRSDK